MILGVIFDPDECLVVEDAAGTIAHGYHILLAIAQHLKQVETLEPEWWP
jgi:hypothetical protein